MPMTISLTPSWPPRLMICSSAGTIASPPSRPKRLVPVYFTSANFSKTSASISLLRMAFLPSAVKRMSLSLPSMRSWSQDFCAGDGDVHELDADLPAVGAAQDLEDLAHGRGLEAEHVVDEDRAVEIGVGEAVGLGLQLRVHLALGEAQRIEVGGEMAHDAIGADQHQRADAVLGRAQRTPSGSGRSRRLGRGPAACRGRLARPRRSRRSSAATSSRLAGLLDCSSGLAHDGPAARSRRRRALSPAGWRRNGATRR